jgi:hypothetical protein
MAILVDENNRVICRGLTRSQGTLHSEQAIASGGMTPRRRQDAGLPARHRRPTLSRDALAHILCRQ